MRVDRDGGGRWAGGGGGALLEVACGGRGRCVAALGYERERRITCREARAHGIAPVRRGHPAYPFMRDGDGDGVVCE